MDKKKNKPKNMSLDDAALWKSMTVDVELMAGKAYEEGCESAENAPDLSMQVTERAIFSEKPKKPAQMRQGREIDRRTAERLRKGKMLIEARIDLHHMNQQQAHEALNAFILASHARGLRCVLVITGKGEHKEEAEADHWQTPERGILRRRVPDWLFEPPIGDCVLQAIPAHRKDGGEGALYVYLRRER